MKTIAFDTSNQFLTAAIFKDGRLLKQLEVNSVRKHSEQLLPIVDELLKSQNWQPKSLEQVIVSQGPGSYTGLRLSVTMAKTLAFTLGLELIGISGLSLLASNVLIDDVLIIPIMDARNENVYSGQYQWKNGKLVVIKNDQHTSIYNLPLEVGNKSVVYVGEYIKFKKIIQKNVPQALFANDNLPHASNMFNLSISKNVLHNPSDIHNFNPKYLRVPQVEANWEASHLNTKNENYVEKIKYK